MAEKQLIEAPVVDTLFGDAKKNWGWLLALGILSIILGTIGLWMTFALTLAGVLLFGVLLLLGGIFQVVDAFKCKGWKGTALHVLIGLIYVAAGAIAIWDPLGAAVALTLLIGAAFIAVGILRLVMAIQHRSARGWGWALAGGIISLVLGVLIILGWPVSGLWVIGVFIAIELIVNGWTYLFIALAARRMAKVEARQGAPEAPSAA
jgi:uncharacterized membrane protein HdeD (DUF308 family)